MMYILIFYFLMTFISAVVGTFVDYKLNFKRNETLAEFFNCDFSVLRDILIWLAWPIVLPCLLIWFGIPAIFICCVRLLDILF